MLQCLNLFFLDTHTYIYIVCGSIYGHIYTHTHIYTSHTLTPVDKPGHIYVLLAFTQVNTGCSSLAYMHTHTQSSQPVLAQRKCSVPTLLVVGMEIQHHREQINASVHNTRPMPL